MSSDQLSRHEHFWGENVRGVEVLTMKGQKGPYIFTRSGMIHIRLTALLIHTERCYSYAAATAVCACVRSATLEGKKCRQEMTATASIATLKQAELPHEIGRAATG